jgi:NADH-quinone oxidoreductase subunit G
MVSNGMKVFTHSKRVLKARRAIIELLLANHEGHCPTCERSQNCELQKLAFELGVRDIRFGYAEQDEPVDISSQAIIRDPNKCIYCGRCVRVCREVQSVGAVDFMNRGIDIAVGTALNKGLGKVECINCGQCILVCPVGAIKERSFTDEVWSVIHEPEKHVVVQAAPSIRVSLGEELGMPAGSLATGKMYAALRRLGFDAVFDTNFAADLTVMEEGSEFIDRLTNGGRLPQFTSCCPAWVSFVEKFFPDLIPHISTAKSPQQMFGAMAKTYYAQQQNICPISIISVSIMPCTAKKFEAKRPEMAASGFRDVDYVLTTRELTRMIKEAGIDFKNLADEAADPLLGSYTGAAPIFGRTGGVMEAALRTAVALLSGKPPVKLEFESLGTMEGIKKAELPLGDKILKVAVVHGLKNARKVCESIQSSGEFSTYHFIEVMACPGGCIGGGGQPIPTNIATRRERTLGLNYDDSDCCEFRMSHENPEIKTLYKNFLEKPLGTLSYNLLHTRHI